VYSSFGKGFEGTSSNYLFILKKGGVHNEKGQAIF
jgi:hypothetical protein